MPTTTPRQAAVRGKALEFITQVLLVTIVPRLLGPAEFGRMTVALTVVTLSGVAISLGAPSAFSRFVPAESESRQAGLARAMTAQLLPIRAVQLAIAALMGVVLVYVGPRFAALDVGLVFIAISAEVGAVLAAQIALGLGATWIWSFRISARNVAMLLLVPILAPLSGGVISSVALASLAGLVFAATQVLPLVRHAERGIEVPAGTLQFGRIFGLGMLLSQVTWRGPVLAASLLGLAADDVGFAGLASSIGMAAIFAVRELFTVSLPEFVTSWNNDQLETDRRLRQLAGRVQWALAACAVIGVVTLERLLPLVVGERFAPAVPPMIPVLAMLPLLPLPAMGVQGASLRLRPGLSVAIDAWSLVAFAAAALVLVPQWGAIGASEALLIAMLAATVLSARAIPTVVSLRLVLSGVSGAAAVLGLAALVGAF
jgi:O-antigen/teichoic acid export membrane protein